MATPANDLRVLRNAVAVFSRFASPRIMVLGLVVAVVARLSVAYQASVDPSATASFTPNLKLPAAGFSFWDASAVLVVVGLIPLVEWFIHLMVLHARPRNIGPIRFDPGAGHRNHHLHPTEASSALLRGVDSALFQVINAGLVVVVVGGPLWLLDVEMVGPVMTGIVAAVVGLLHYEWSHFLFHTAYRPKTRYYRRLKSNHRLHHWRNERYWLGITSNVGDRLLGTYAASRSTVPLTHTARKLVVDPELQ